MTEFTLRIDGMHCGSCIRRVTAALSATPAVHVEEVRLGAARLKSEEDPPPVDPAIASLAKAGFIGHLQQ